MDHGCQDDILALLQESDRLIDLAKDGETNSNDDSCVLLFCIVRDCAYKIRHMAEMEREAHIANGTWDASAEKAFFRKRAPEDRA